MSPNETRNRRFLNDRCNHGLTKFKSIFCLGVLNCIDSFNRIESFQAGQLLCFNLFFESLAYLMRKASKPCCPNCCLNCCPGLIFLNRFSRSLIPGVHYPERRTPWLCQSDLVWIVTVSRLGIFRAEQRQIQFSAKPSNSVH